MWLNVCLCMFRPVMSDAVVSLHVVISQRTEACLKELCNFKHHSGAGRFPDDPSAKWLIGFQQNYCSCTAAQCSLCSLQASVDMVLTCFSRGPVFWARWQIVSITCPVVTGDLKQRLFLQGPPPSVLKAAFGCMITHMIKHRKTHTTKHTSVSQSIWAFTQRGK